MAGDTSWSCGMSTEQAMAQSAGESGPPCLTRDSGFSCTMRTTPLPTPNTKGEVSMDSMSDIMGGGGEVLEECDEVVVVHRIKCLSQWI